MPRVKKWTDTLTRPFEVKAGSFATETKADGAKVGRFEGYLSVFGNEDSWGDVVEPGAFTRTIEQNKGRFPLLWFHDPAEPIGVFAAKEDERGLYITAYINLETQRGREVYSGMKFDVDELDGDGAYISELSIGFKAIGKETDEDDVRHLTEVALSEGSLLTMHFAANPEATVTVKDTGERMSTDEARAIRTARDDAEAVADTLTDLLASVPVTGDGALTDERKAEVAEAVGRDLFAAPEPPETPDDEPEPLNAETHAAILAAVKHARATLAR